MVLINLASAKLLDAIRGLPEAVLVPPRVLEETAGVGERLGYPEAIAIREAVEAGTLRVAREADSRVIQRLRRETRLREADASVVAIAMRERAYLGSDDAKVRRVAEFKGVTCGGTGYILSRLIAEGVLKRGEARSSLDALIAGGWYCDVDTYARILGQLGL
ncbi:MAG TPA: DUF3368 domain-containing protein [Thermoplasmata archaeon]